MSVDIDARSDIKLTSRLEEMRLVTNLQFVSSHSRCSKELTRYLLLYQLHSIAC